HPNRHPDAFVSAFIAVRSKSHFRGAFSATALTSLAQKDLMITRADAAEARWITPLPAFLPAQLLKPLETLLNVRDVKYRSKSFCQHHGRSSIRTRIPHLTLGESYGCSVVARPLTP